MKFGYVLLGLVTLTSIHISSGEYSLDEFGRVTPTLYFPRGGGGVANSTAVSLKRSMTWDPCPMTSLRTYDAMAHHQDG